MSAVAVQSETGRKQRVLAILGMHRSGTSLAAELITRMGASTGKELIPANEYNQYGYGEDATVVGLHDSLLGALERSWNTLRGTFPLPKDWIKRPEYQTAIKELGSYLRSEFARVGGDMWAVKDPRISTLLPLWFALEKELDFNLELVLCVRNPHAVAASVRHRDGMPAELALLIWLQFNTAIVADAGSRIRAVLDYDTWFAEPRRNIGLLTDFFVPTMSDKERDDLVESVVNSSLRHYQGQSPTGVFAKWDHLLRERACTQKMPAELHHEAQLVTEYLDAFAPWRQAITDQKYLMSMIDHREAELRDVIRVANLNLAAYRKMDAEFVAARQAIARLEHERDDVVAVANQNLEAYREIDARHQDALRTLHEREAQHQQREAQHQQREAQHQRVVAAFRSRFGFFPFSLLWPSNVVALNKDDEVNTGSPQG